MSPLSPDQIPEKWSAIASSYEKSFEGLSAQYAAEAVRRLEIRRGERVLDVAAGTGAFSLLAARAGAEVLATDFAPGMVARLRERIAAAGLAGISAEVMDGQALDLPGASFDAAASILGLIFFPDIPKGIAEMRRVLRPGGRAAIVCWDDVRRLRLITLMMEAVRRVVPEFEAPPGLPAWARLAGAGALEAAMRAAGFHDIEVFPVMGRLTIESPEEFWNDFQSSAPPLAFLFHQIGPERAAAVGRAYMERVVAESPDGSPTIEVEACLGIGRVPR